jgi:ABC-type transport system substrate-binding protein
VDAARQRLAPVRRLAALAAVAVLAGCGSSSPAPERAASLRLTVPLVPRTLDPARVADLPSLNVAHELYAGLTRFSGRGVAPDLAESWDIDQGGLVWTFHLRRNLRWSDDRPLTAEDFRRSWLRALDPKTGAALAGPDLGIVKGARAYHARGRGTVGVETLDRRTLRVTLQHPVPWFDQLVAFPIAFPAPSHGGVFSGPFRLVVRRPARLVLERNFNYWNAAEVKPSRIVLTRARERTDGTLPRGLAPPGLPWIDTAGPAPKGSTKLPTLATGLMWLVTRGTPLADRRKRQFIAWVVTHLDLGGPPASLVPHEMPGAAIVNSHKLVRLSGGLTPLHLTVAWARQDLGASRVAATLRHSARRLRDFQITLGFRPVPTLGSLLALAGPPARPGVDLVLLGWSSKIFDAYNLLDLFPCGSAFNVARWCDPSYDGLMRQAVRTLDERARWRIERTLVEKIHDAVPATAVYSPTDHVRLAPGVHGFSWSPIGFYELMGMTRS